MKSLITALSFAFVAQAHADSVIIMKEGISEIPTTVRAILSGHEYQVKPMWTKPHLTLQSLPKDVWQRAQRQPQMAIRVEGTVALESLLPEGVASIEENVALDEFQTLDRYRFDPAKCPGVIYGFGHFTTAMQELSATDPCDNFALRPRGDVRYRVVVESDSPKMIEVYEHGDLIGTGAGSMEVDFTFGYRQKYLIVQGEPGPYRLSVYPAEIDPRKQKLIGLALSNDFSNAYGFGIPKLGPLLDKDQSPSEWTGANMMGAESFWKKGFTGKGIKVAIVDTGIDVNHPFFKDSVVGGYTPFNKGTSPEDYQDHHGHGTHVAGIVRQVAPDAQLLAVRVFPNEVGNGEAATYDVIADGIRWAIDNGAQVINLSLGGDGLPSSFKEVFEFGAAKGVLFAMASGNDRSLTPLTPASYAGEIAGVGFSVGATDKYGDMAVFSNYTGNNLYMKHLAAHGAGVLSAAIGRQGFVKMSGTSMATPQIAGVLALYRQAFPSKSNTELMEFMAAQVQRAGVND